MHNHPVRCAQKHEKNREIQRRKPFSPNGDQDDSIITKCLLFIMSRLGISYLHEHQLLQTQEVASFTGLVV